MDALTTLINNEHARLRVLENEIAERKQRIETLKAMQSSEALDAVLDGKIKAPIAHDAIPDVAQVVAHPANNEKEPQRTTQPRQLHKKGEVKNILLKLLKREPQHINQIRESAQSLGYEFSSDRIRADLWSIKQDKLVANEKRGFFYITPEGEAYVASLNGEVPTAGTPSDTSSATMF